MTDLYNDEFRHRVIAIGIIYPDSGTIYPDVVREFKTTKAADKYAEKLIREGKNVVIQHGRLHWMTEQEVEEMESFVLERTTAF